MRIACLVSGQPRHVDQGIIELKKFMNGIDVDYFNHHWLDESEHGVVKYSANRSDMSVWFTEEKTSHVILNTLSPKKYEFEKQIRFEPKRNYETRSQTKQEPWAFMSMTYSRKRVFQLLESYVNESSNSYDFVCLTRTDMMYQRQLDTDFFSQCDPNTFYTLKEPGSGWNVDYINDPFVFSSFDNMKHYCSLFDDFDKHWTNGIDFCLHRLAMAQMKEIEGIQFDSILNKSDWSYIRTK